MKPTLPSKITLNLNITLQANPRHTVSIFAYFGVWLAKIQIKPSIFKMSHYLSIFCLYQNLIKSYHPHNKFFTLYAMVETN